jgi:hypothetical protein
MQLPNSLPILLGRAFLEFMPEVSGPVGFQDASHFLSGHDRFLVFPSRIGFASLVYMSNPVVQVSPQCQWHFYFAVGDLGSILRALFRLTVSGYALYNQLQLFLSYYHQIQYLTGPPLVSMSIRHYVIYLEHRLHHIEAIKRPRKVPTLLMRISNLGTRVPQSRRQEHRGH